MHPEMDEININIERTIDLLRMHWDYKNSILPYRTCELSYWRGRRDLNSRGEYHRISNPARYQAMRRPLCVVRDTARLSVSRYIMCRIRADTMLAGYLQHQGVSNR